MSTRAQIYVAEEFTDWVRSMGFNGEGQRKEERAMDIATVLKKHRLWLNDEEGGEYADLRGADMPFADMRHADMRFADMRHADMRFADMRRANMRHAELRGADMPFADMRHADMRGADMRLADMRYAELRGADMRYANDAPLSVQVGPWPVYIKSGYMRIGCECHSVEDWRSLDDDRIADMDAHALDFWRANREWLLAACEAQMATIRGDV